MLYLIQFCAALTCLQRDGDCDEINLVVSIFLLINSTALGPLFKRRETRLADGFPIARFMLFEQAVAH